VPVAGGTTTNLETYDHTQIDDIPDPALDDNDWLTGTDPSGTAPNITFEGSADNTGNPTTSTSVTIPATVQNNDIILVSVANGDGTAQPTISDNSGVNNWTDGVNGGVVRHQAGTAMGGTVFWKRITNAATEASKVVSLSGMTGSTVANLSVRRGCVTSGSPVDGTPVSEGNASGNNTQAGITTLTDGAAVHVVVFYSDNTASTTNMTATSPATITKGGEIYSSGGNDSGLAHFREIKAAAGATGAISWSPGTNQISVSIAFALKPQSVAAQTVNTEVRAPMSNPTGTLATGAATGTLELLVGKLGSGSNPSVKVEAYESTDVNTLGSLLATIIADTAVSTLTSAGGVKLSNTFNQNIFTNPNNAIFKIVGTGASGGLVEVGALRWTAQKAVAAAQPVKLVGMVGIRGAA
jgi:hypothetical protein